MKKYFPPQNQSYTYLQNNRSNILGSLWSTFNLDFQTNLGAIRLSQKLVTNTTTTDDADLGRPSAFEYFDGRWWALCGTHCFKNSSEAITGTFADDTSTNFITTYDSDESDLAVFDTRLWSSAPGKLYSKVANGSGTGSWTNRTGAATLGGVIEKLGYFKKFNRLYFVNDEYEIGSVNEGNTISVTGDYSIDLGDTVGVITTFATNSDFVWIGTMQMSNNGGLGISGTIEQWDGISQQVSNSFDVEAGGVVAICVYNNIPYSVDTNGRILRYNGTSFDEIARLPINRIFLRGVTIDGETGGRFVHYNGFVPTKNNTLLIAVNNLNEDAGDTINENLASGIWELDLDTYNFTHRYSFTLQARGSSTITDFGQNRLVGIGALKLNPYATDSSNGQGTLLAGSTYYTNAGATTLSAIFLDSPASPNSDTEGQKRGYFVTTWFNSDEIQDKWIRLWSTFRRFLNSTDKITFKYRLNEEAPLEATITWTSTTTFTTTTDVTAYGPTASGFDGVTGGEVEGLQGLGSGSCTHISSITGSGTYTVTLDNPVTGAGGSVGAKVRFQKWIKLLPEITGQVNSFAQVSITSASNIRIQIKGVMEFTGDDEFYKMAIFSNEDIKINA